MTTEFNLIKQYFTRPTTQTDLGVGDDAALIQVSAGHQLAISSDMSVVGTHFFENAVPDDIGWKSLAVNISDMAAMGAKPKWATLSIALPDANEDWLNSFSTGFFDCANQFSIDLIGGDTTRGPLNISVTIMGETPIGQSIQRSGAKIGDDIWVSGHLGQAALGLAYLQEHITLEGATQALCLTDLHRPQPRVSLGLALRDIANSCIDVSDGLLADLGHILNASASGVGAIGAHLQLENIAGDDVIKARLHEPNIQQAILAGGDDYELCFTASPKQRAAIASLSKQLNLPLSRIGEINQTGKLIVTLAQQTVDVQQFGYEHFAK